MRERERTEQNNDNHSWNIFPFCFFVHTLAYYFCSAVLLLLLLLFQYFIFAPHRKKIEFSKKKTRSRLFNSVRIGIDRLQKNPSIRAEQNWYMLRSFQLGMRLQKSVTIKWIIFNQIDWNVVAQISHYTQPNGRDM